MLSEIVNAIHNKSLIEIDYTAGNRVVEPHAIGRSKDGEILFRAYQRSGASESGKTEYWKLFRLDRTLAIHDTQMQFSGPRPQYNPNDPAMKGGIIACL